MSENQTFDHQTVIVTGAASGIGRATTKRLLGLGSRVIATDVVGDRLDMLAAEHPDDDIVTVTGDVTDQAVVDAILAAAGARVDGLANVAGIMDAFVPAHEVTDALWDRVMRINVTGPMMLTRAVLPLMINAKRGSIVNVSSEAALRGSSAGAAYTTSKHAIVGFTRSLAFMYGPDGIRANSVAPGPVETGIETHISSGYALERLAAAGPLGYSAAVPPSIMADSIVWLLSDASANVNGVVLPSDGGWSVF